MPQWTDLFLATPLSQGWLHGLLFLTFGLHLLFVLLMLGTALLGLLFFLRERLSDNPSSQLWNAKMVHTHLGLKSLAVVLGVAPLLIMQVSNSHTFFTVTGLFSYAWVAIIPLLIFAFLLIDAFGHKMNSNATLAFACGVLGVGALLTVPAIFTGALTLMERPKAWPGFAAHGFSLGAPFALHWALRYLHVVGAALVFGAAFHWMFSTRDKPEKAARLRAWLLGATMAQVVIGLALLLSVLEDLTMPAMAAVTVGLLALALMFWGLYTPAGRTPRVPRFVLALLPVVFLSMLLGRQFLQEQALAPAHAQAVGAREQRSADLAPFSKKALDAFTLKLNTVYDNGDTIYDGACQPCHGANGNGQGPEAAFLHVPAEDLRAIRADRDYVYAIVRDGTPGSGMPYFRLYDREKLESLLQTLDKRFAMFAPTPQPKRDISAEALDVWVRTCAVCHAANGSVSDFGRTLLPAPPDLRRFSLSRQRALHVITEGYPGTVMQPYRNLPEAVLEDLATISNNFRREH